VTDTAGNPLAADKVWSFTTASAVSLWAPSATPGTPAVADPSALELGVKFRADNNYFATSGVDSPPLHAVKEGDSGGNGVFAYTATSAFPTSSYQSTNYRVDIVFATTP
jgi:hypothetical protein